MKTCALMKQKISVRIIASGKLLSLFTPRRKERVFSILPYIDIISFNSRQAVIQNKFGKIYFR